MREYLLYRYAAEINNQAYLNNSNNNNKMIFDQRDLEKGKKSLRGSSVVLTLVTAIGVTVYFAIYKPLFLEPEKYQRIQKEVRREIKQNKIQPGDMRVWSDPFKPLPKEEE